jgi:predicted nucleic acid-binding protein
VILLDTNVISALMQPTPDLRVRGWLNRHEAQTLFLSTITVAEIGFGLCVLPEGQRRRRLEERFERFLAEGFEHRLLSFELPSARLYAEIMSSRRALGRPMSMADGQIAAIARARLLKLATRNTKDFEHCGVELVDPFLE